MVNAYFLDTSALVKRYVPELGSNWVRSITVPAAGNFIALVAIPETQLIFVSADNRLLNIARSEGLAIDNPNNYP